MDGFDPEHSYDRLPSAGIPRILRPRKKHGTVYGLSVVDPGGDELTHAAELVDGLE